MLDNMNRNKFGTCSLSFKQFIIELDPVSTICANHLLLFPLIPFPVLAKERYYKLRKILLTNLRKFSVFSRTFSKFLKIAVLVDPNILIPC